MPTRDAIQFTDRYLRPTSDGPNLRYLFVGQLISGSFLSIQKCAVELFVAFILFWGLPRKVFPIYAAKLSFPACMAGMMFITGSRTLFNRTDIAAYKLMFSTYVAACIPAVGTGKRPDDAFVTTGIKRHQHKNFAFLQSFLLFALNNAHALYASSRKMEAK